MDDAHATPARANRLLLALAVAFVLIELLPSLSGSYGYFIDELYYVACSERLALGYVDHPPLAPWVLRASRAVLGDSQLALRVLPALAGAGTVLLTGLIARRLGAGAFGQGLAALAIVTAPIPLVMFGFYSVNAFEILGWTAASYLLVELARRDEPRLWLAVGAVAGLALLSKHTFVLYAAGLLAGLLLTRARRHLASRWLWAGVGIAALLLAPNLIWQLQTGWPSLEFYRNADLLKSVPTPRLEVLFLQVLYMNPVGALLWSAGVVSLLFTRPGRPYAFLGWLFLALLALIVLGQRSRPDRIAGAYPIVLAAGAVVWEGWTERRFLRWLRWVLPALAVAIAAVFAPIVLPVVPPAQLAPYAARLGVVPQIEQGKATAVPQWLADRLGWQEFADEVVLVVERELAPDERARAVIVAPSYGQAGALEFLGRGRGLPPVASVQNTYHLWGLPEGPLDVVIAVGFGPGTLGELFEEVELAATIDCPYCPAWRDDEPIHVARRPKVSLREAWEGFKSYQ